MTKVYPILFILAAGVCHSASQSPSTPSVKPSEHVLGTITSIDTATHTAVVKDDKSGVEKIVLLADTKTLLKVEPGAKDLKSAVRITANQLAVGDRVDVRGFKSAEDPAKVSARSVVLMSGRDLQAAHAAQEAAWQHSTAGVITGLDPAKGTLDITERSPTGPKPAIVQTSPETEFTRYSPENPKTPATSEMSQLQTGDRVRVIGNVSGDGSMITARKLYSGAFRILNGTIVSISSDGKQLVIRDLATRKPVTVVLNEGSAIHKLPPEMAAHLAQRSAVRAHTGGGPPAQNAAAEHAPIHGTARGDISAMIERLPNVSLTDLKPGEAVVISGVLDGAGGTQLLATNVIAGVEPILQAAPAGRQRAGSGGGESAGGDWGLEEMSIPQ